MESAWKFLMLLEIKLKLISRHHQQCPVLTKPWINRADTTTLYKKMISAKCRLLAKTFTDIVRKISEGLMLPWFLWSILSYVGSFSFSTSPYRNLGSHPNKSTWMNDYSAVCACGPFWRSRYQMKDKKVFFLMSHELLLCLPCFMVKIAQFLRTCNVFFRLP